MAKAIKFKNNIYLSSKGIVYNRETLQNKLDRVGVACRSGADDIFIKSSSSWNVEKYNNLPSFDTSNSELFESYNSSGIKVKKDGLFVISGTINVDMNSTGGSACIITSEGHLMVCDYCQHNSMTSMVVPSVALRLRANSIIWLAYRFEDPGTSFRTRGSRSYLSVMAI